MSHLVPTFRPSVLPTFRADLIGLGPPPGAATAALTGRQTERQHPGGGLIRRRRPRGSRRLSSFSGDAIKSLLASFGSPGLQLATLKEDLEGDESPRDRAGACGAPGGRAGRAWPTRSRPAARPEGAKGRKVLRLIGSDWRRHRKH